MPVDEARPVAAYHEEPSSFLDLRSDVNDPKLGMRVDSSAPLHGCQPTSSDGAMHVLERYVGRN